LRLRACHDTKHSAGRRGRARGQPRVDVKPHAGPPAVGRLAIGRLHSEQTTFGTGKMKPSIAAGLGRTDDLEL